MSGREFEDALKHLIPSATTKMKRIRYRQCELAMALQESIKQACKNAMGERPSTRPPKTEKKNVASGRITTLKGFGKDRVSLLRLARVAAYFALADVANNDWQVFGTSKDLSAFVSQENLADEAGEPVAKSLPTDVLSDDSLDELLQEEALNADIAFPEN